MEVFSSLGEFDAHVILHVGHDKCCKWEGCQGYTADSLKLLEAHVIRHVYDASTFMFVFIDCLQL